MNSEFTHAVSLPPWLDKLLFQDLEAQYSPNHERYSYNLDISGDEIKTYLGTYFPRSYAESYCICDNLFQNTIYRYEIAEREVIKVLDFGCGTGGNIIGFLEAVEKNFSSVKKIEITAVDGNQEALRMLERIRDSYLKQNHCFEVDLKPFPVCIGDSYSLEDIDDLLVERYDFILSFKVAGEFFLKDALKGNVYEKFVALLLPKLSLKGLMIFLDVTIYDEATRNFLPIHMNRGINEFLKENQDFATLIPMHCYYLSNRCKESCFTQQFFCVSHNQRKTDKSKVSYRIIGRKTLADKCVPLLLPPPKRCQVTKGDSKYYNFREE